MELVRVAEFQMKVKYVRISGQIRCGGERQEELKEGSQKVQTFNYK